MTTKSEPDYCSECGRLIKTYRRLVNKTMVRALLKMYELGGTKEFVHTPTRISVNGGDISKMEIWGLIERSPTEREDHGRDGWWRVTTFGRSFLRGEVTISKYAEIYLGVFQQFSGPQVSVSDCYKEFFDLRKLMNE